jgi:hypothetical protein
MLRVPLGHIASYLGITQETLAESGREKFDNFSILGYFLI